MVSASLFGLVDEGLQEGAPLEIGTGVVVGVVLVVVVRDVLLDADIDPKEYEEDDFKKPVLILGILTVHSFPEASQSASPLPISASKAAYSFSDSPSRYCRFS